MKEDTMIWEEIKQKLSASKQFAIVAIEEMAHGKRIRTNTGCIINCFTTGKITYQGKNCSAVKELIEGRTANNKRIFVVYGHDTIAKTQLEALLRRWDLDPVILDQEASAGQTIIEKLETYSADIGYAIVLATPDDEGKAKEESHTKKRVRQNVVLELGMFLAKLGREKVAILLKEDKDFEKPSDIQGLIYIPFQNKVEDAAIYLLKELAKQGYNIDNKNL